jgi:uncharacterized FlaG/YvyC family protein
MGDLAIASHLASRASSARAGSAASSTAPPMVVADARYQNAANPSNDALVQSGRKMEFAVDQTIDRIIVTVIDTYTDKVLQQVPTDSMLVTARVLENPPAKGTLVDSLA